MIVMCAKISACQELQEINTNSLHKDLVEYLAIVCPVAFATVDEYNSNVVAKTM